MSDLTSMCQRCGAKSDAWRVMQSEMNVGRLKHWKLQMCEDCTAHVERAIIAALFPTQFASQETKP